METPTWTDQRMAVSGTRRRPRSQHCVRFAAETDGNGFSTEGRVPTDIFVEATGPDGDTAPWFDDHWWMECLARWKDEKLAIHVLPSPASLLHPVVLHHVRMARRVALAWRLVGHCWLEELDLDTAPEAIAASPYHEVRIIDAPMPNPVGGGNPRHPLAFRDLVGRVRRAQREMGRTLPVLSRSTERPDAR